MAGIPFLSRILALAGIKVRNASLNAPTGKEVNITVSPLQVGDSIDVDLPNISGRLVTSTEVIPATDKSSTSTGVPNGVANLDGSGKIHVEQLPPLAITDVFVVADETERLALDAQVGDVAIQTDNSTTWMLTALPASTASNWTQISNADYIHEIVTPTGTLTGPSVPLDAATLEAVDINGDTMTGVLTMGPIGTLTGETGQIAFKELAPGNHSVILRAPDTLADYVILTLPEGHGSAGQVLSTQGSSGILEWIDNTAAGAVLTVNGQSGPNVVLDASDVGAVAKAGDTMTGNLTLGTTSTTPGQTRELRFGELSPDGVAVGSDYVGFKAPDTITTSVIWTLPSANGTAGQVLTTSLSGALSWQNTVTSVNGSSGVVTVQELVHPTPGSTFERGEANIGMTGVNNTAYGVDAGDALTGGENNTALGSNALSGMTTGSYNVAIGSYALDLVTAGTSNVAIGTYALQNNQGSYNIAIGESANNGGNSSYGIAIGTAATLFGGFYSTLIGYNLTSSHSGAVVIGNDNTGAGNTSNADNEFVLGTSLHEYILSGRVKSVLSLGTASAAGEARFYESDNSSTSYIGLKAASSLAGNTTYTLPAAPMTSGMILSSTTGGELSWVDAIPAGVVTSVNGESGPTITVQELVHPNTTNTFEYQAVTTLTSGTKNTILGVEAGTAITSGMGNVGLGYRSLKAVTNAQANTAIGESALNNCATGSNNTAIGNSALYRNPSSPPGNYECNTAIGSSAGGTGNNNVAVGFSALIDANTESVVAIGYNAGNSIIATNSQMIGSLAIASGQYNTVIGHNINISSVGSVIIGNDSSGGSGTVTANDQFVLGTLNHKYQMHGKVETALSLSSTDAGGQVKFYESTLTYYAGLKASSSLAANVTWTLPTADGTLRQVLITNGSGDLSFTSLTTADVAEDTNLYFTDERARDAITGAASTIVSSNLTVDRALISNGSGKVAVSSVTSTELGHLSGVTSAIQTQINGKVSTSGDTMTGALSMGPVGVLPGETNEIRFLELVANGSNYVGFKAPDSIDSDIIWTLPADNGSAANYTLRNNGSGVLTWSETVDDAARARLDQLEESRGVYTGNIQTGSTMDISPLIGTSLTEYPIVQIYKNVLGVYENINVEFSFNSSTNVITFGEVADGPISVVIHVLALTEPVTTLSVTL